MPRKFLFTRDEITQAALELVREKGAQALTARALGERLGTSAKPVFGLFKNMEDVRETVIAAAAARLDQLTRAEMTAGRYPPYKASGMAYIRFASEEKELFKLLYMRDRSQEAPSEDEREAIRPLLQVIMKNTGLSEERAYLLHAEMWIFVHGVASMLATSYLNWDMDFASRALTDAYQGLCARHIEEEKKDVSHQNGQSDQKV